MALIEAEEIMKILPHRYPMLLVDRVIECDFKKTIVGIKNLTMNEIYFQGHFPNRPIMPGVLQLEALAQLGGILLNRIIDRQGMISYFAGIDNARFRRVLIPGDQLRMEVTLEKFRLGTAKVQGKVSVEGEIAAEASMLFRVAEVENE